MVNLYGGGPQLSELVSKGQTFIGVQFPYPVVLREGDRGGEVEVLQYMLSLLAEFTQTIQAPAMDGIFGPATAQAVREYQRLVNLTPDGVVNEETWNSIYDSFARAEYFLRRDTVRAQSLGKDAVQVMGTPEESQRQDFSQTPRVGQFPGQDLRLGQRDEAPKRQGEVMV